MPTRGGRGRQRGPSKAKPQPTHFLCLPIVNATSKQQLADSIRRFRSVVTESERQPADNESGDVPNSTPSPRIPESAFRPLGTLHLTLGVMHLKEGHRLTKSERRSSPRTEDRTPPRPGSDSEGPKPELNQQSSSKPQGHEAKTLEEALSYLHSLDLAEMLIKIANKNITGSADAAIPMSAVETRIDHELEHREAGNDREMLYDDSESSSKKRLSLTAEPPDQIDPTTSSPASVPWLHKPISPPPLQSSLHPRTTPQPIEVLLSGLSCFPSATKATVLHIPPHDATNRLQPFAESLRDAFVSAGFLQPENRPLKLHASVVNTIYAGKEKRMAGQPAASVGRKDIVHESRGRAEKDVLLHAEDTEHHSEQHASKADEVQTVGDRSNSQFQSIHQSAPQTHENPKRNRRKRTFSRLTLDAGEILEAFNRRGGRLISTWPNDDSTSQETTPAPPSSTHVQPSNHTQPAPSPLHTQQQHQQHPNLGLERKASTSDPTSYTWATNVLIDRVRICKMGAKPVPGENDNDDEPSLEQEYEVVGEKMIFF